MLPLQKNIMLVLGSLLTPSNWLKVQFRYIILEVYFNRSSSSLICQLKMNRHPSILKTEISRNIFVRKKVSRFKTQLSPLPRSQIISIFTTFLQQLSVSNLFPKQLQNGSKDAHQQGPSQHHNCFCVYFQQQQLEKKHFQKPGAFVLQSLTTMSLPLTSYSIFFFPALQKCREIVQKRLTFTSFCHPSLPSWNIAGEKPSPEIQNSSILSSVFILFHRRKHG